jgi:hypothetical protein
MRPSEWRHFGVARGLRGVLAVSMVLAACLALPAVSGARPATWSVQKTPPRLPAFSGLSCTSDSSCAAVGGFFGAGAGRWDGTRWMIEKVPDPVQGQSPNFPQFPAVSCTSSSACIAVGSYDAGPLQRLFVERWDGVRWSLQKPPTPPDTLFSAFNAVSCTSIHVCTAVGYYTGAGGLPTSQTLAEQWDGSRWTIEPMPAISSGPASLNGVWCTSSRACTAVGEVSAVTSTGLALSRTLAERWDGTQWSIEPTPIVPRDRLSELLGVSCTSSTSCTAVGDTSPGPGVSLAQSTLAELWNGTSWSIEPTANAARVVNQLTGVSCTSSDACTAVGWSENRDFFYFSLAERWDGARWSIQATPNLDLREEDNMLSAVSCSARFICIAVGESADRALAIRWAAASASLTGIPAKCTSTPLDVRVKGNQISSVTWSLDTNKIPGRRVQAGTLYGASISIPPGRHTLTVKVKFVASAHAPAHMVHRTVLGCSPGPPLFTG